MTPPPNKIAITPLVWFAAFMLACGAGTQSVSNGGGVGEADGSGKGGEARLAPSPLTPLAVAVVSAVRNPTAPSDNSWVVWDDGLRPTPHPAWEVEGVFFRLEVELQSIGAFVAGFVLDRTALHLVQWEHRRVEATTEGEELGRFQPLVGEVIAFLPKVRIGWPAGWKGPDLPLEETRGRSGLGKTAVNSARFATIGLFVRAGDEQMVVDLRGQIRGGALALTRHPGAKQSPMLVQPTEFLDQDSGGGPDTDEARSD